MTRYTLGDTPAEALVVVPTRDGDEVDLELYNDATSTLLDPAGQSHSCPAAIVPAADEDDVAHVAITLPKLDVPGLQLLQLQLHTGSGGMETFDVESVVVETPTGWHSLASARSEWAHARELDDVDLFVLLETARIECLAYAPKLPAGTLPPINYRQAQLMHARNRNAASRVDPATGDNGTESYTLGTFPLDWTVQQLLRPRRRLGRVR